MLSVSTNSIRRSRLGRLTPCLFALLGLLAVRASSADDAQAREVIGNWLTQDRDGIIQISVASDGTYQGRIVCCDDAHRLDQNNPDPALRHEPLVGHIIMQGMRYEGGGRWSGGTIRDPNNGRSYKCRLQLLDSDRLQLRGFIGFSLLGRSQLWTRHLGSSMDLPPPSEKKPD